MSNNDLRARKNRRLLLIGGLVALGMFGFGFALVPLYNVLCNVTGLNGKTYSEAVPLMDPSRIDHSRILTVQFVANTNANLPWKFYPLTSSITLHPGENKKVYYHVENNSGHDMTVQAIPSLAPGEAAKYMKKTECFCFTQQFLKSGESRDMPVLFHVDPSINKEFTTLSLSYTLFDVSRFLKNKSTQN